MRDIQSLEEREAEYIYMVLKSYTHTPLKTIASKLGISRATLYRKLQKHKLEKDFAWSKDGVAGS